MKNKRIVITFPIEPVAQARPRATVIQARNSRSRTVRLYDPAATKTFKQQIGNYAKKHMRKNELEPIGEPLKLTLVFYRPLTKALSGNKNKRIRAISGEVVPATKPDTSNYLKSFEDGLNGIVWHDDAAITDITVSKRYGDPARIEMIAEPTEKAVR